ncbi:DUF421 domain-containing protein [Cryomorphaceae bacterium 1068]|nr:DUF421 domain-containing protein [Cryomorphaceae bacterium 1068]
MLDISEVPYTFSQGINLLQSSLLIYISVIVIMRINGLRTFAKFTGFDFAITIAIGSIISASLMSTQTKIIQGALAIAALIALQSLIAFLRKRSQTFQAIVSNKPILLMKNSEFLEENMRKGGVTKDDIYGKLREANVLSIKMIKAVVLEPTGDVSVLHGNIDDNLDQVILSNVEDK